MGSAWVTMSDWRGSISWPQGRIRGSEYFGLKIHIVSVGHRMPEWIQAGFQDFARRLPAHWHVELLELEPDRNLKTAPVARRKAHEGQRLLAVTPKLARVIALDEQGRQWDSRQWADRMTFWLQDGRDLAFWIGGADGLDAGCLAVAEERWSLSKLTFPHGLVRILLVEQLYRGWSIAQGHPYHRA